MCIQLFQWTHVDRISLVRLQCTLHVQRSSCHFKLFFLQMLYIGSLASFHCLNDFCIFSLKCTLLTYQFQTPLGGSRKIVISSISDTRLHKRWKLNWPKEPHEPGQEHGSSNLCPIPYSYRKPHCSKYAPSVNSMGHMRAWRCRSGCAPDLLKLSLHCHTLPGCL